MVTIQDLHSQNARIYILADYEVDWLDILLIGRLLLSLPMCKLYYIRKRKRTTCTYAAAGPEQLQNSHFKVESTMNVFDGSFAKRMYTPYGGTHTNLAARCKVLPE